MDDKVKNIVENFEKIVINPEKVLNFDTREIYLSTESLLDIISNEVFQDLKHIQPFIDKIILAYNVFSSLLYELEIDNSYGESSTGGGSTLNYAIIYGVIKSDKFEAIKNSFKKGIEYKNFPKYVNLSNFIKKLSSCYNNLENKALNEYGYKDIIVSYNIFLDFLVAEIYDLIKDLGDYYFSLSERNTKGHLLSAIRKMFLLYSNVDVRINYLTGFYPFQVDEYTEIINYKEELNVIKEIEFDLSLSIPKITNSKIKNESSNESSGDKIESQKEEIKNFTLESDRISRCIYLEIAPFDYFKFTNLDDIIDNIDLILRKSKVNFKLI